MKARARYTIKGKSTAISEYMRESIRYHMRSITWIISDMRSKLAEFPQRRSSMTSGATLLWTGITISQWHPAMPKLGPQRNPGLITGYSRRRALSQSCIFCLRNFEIQEVNKGGGDILEHLFTNRTRFHEETRIEIHLNKTSRDIGVVKKVMA